MDETTEHPPASAAPPPGRTDRSYTPSRAEQGGAMTSRGTRRFDGRPERSREPLTRAERILIGMFAALLGSGVVGFTAINGQLVGIQRQIGDLRAEMHQEIGGLRTEMHREIGDLREEMHRDIGGLRVDIAELSDRVTRVETRLPTPGPSGS